MSINEKQAEREEGRTEVKENDSKLSSPERLIKPDEADTEADANVAEDQELKVSPENDGEEEKVVEVKHSSIKSLPRATTTATPIDKRKKKEQSPLQEQEQKKQQQKKEVPIPNVSKKLEQQSTEIKKIKSILQSQSQLIKQLKSQLKQVQNQISRIQKHSAKKKMR
jgi:hypothetical protein